MSKGRTSSEQGLPVDERMFMNAEEAAAELGVTVETLYSYVSRKKIRTKRVDGTRKRLYWRADVSRARRGGAKARPDADIAQTDITLVTAEGPYYRGRNAIELSETLTLEQTAALLWQVDEDSIFTSTLPSAPPGLEALSKVLDDAVSTDKAIALLPFLEQANPRAFDLSPSGMSRTGADVLRWYAAILTDADRPSAAPMHEQIADRVSASHDVADLIRRMLVLSADHGFGAGTFAVRAVASTGVSPYRSVVAGLAITAGRRSRLGRSESLWRFMSEVADSNDPAKIVIQRLRDGETVPGFDSPAAYEMADPRAEALIGAVERVYGDHPTFRKVMTAATAVKDAFDLSPSFALANMLTTTLSGLPHNRVLYVLGRCAGWIAHSIEQYQIGEMVSPQAIYRGALPND
jgi:citrate synthase